MKAITRLRNSLTLSSIGQTFNQPAFWTVGDMLGSVVGDREKLTHDFDGYVQKSFKENGVVFTTVLVRQFILGEARFQYQRLQQGRPGDLWGDQTLSLLENPWPNGTTGELIARMEQDASFGGNFFATKVEDEFGQRLRRLRPDWVTIVTEAPRRDDGSPGSPFDIGARVSGYIYKPPGEEPTLLPADRVVHYSPIPDPSAQWRGMSWVTAIGSEVMADKAATKHKLKFFENGASSNIVLSYDKDYPVEKVRANAELFREQHAGVNNAYKTIHLGGGVDPHMVGADLKQLDFKVTQGAGESRIAAASLVGAVLAQFSEGMQGSSLNAGNFNAAKRRFADVGARPLWRMMAASLAKVVPVPPSNRLWYDDRDIPFLQDDAKDAAEILAQNAQAIRTLTDGGYDGESAVQAIVSGDLRLLKHTGLPSVQVQPASQPDARITVPVTAVKALLEDGWELVPELAPSGS